tara:strand:+ start:1886 stop:2218 length:333 start_codon:yes stop_codon:yes gene_type:complete
LILPWQSHDKPSFVCKQENKLEKLLNYISIKSTSARILTALKTESPAIFLGLELKTSRPKSLPRIDRTKENSLRALSRTIKRSVLNRRLSTKKTVFGNCFLKYKKNILKK